MLAQSAKCHHCTKEGNVITNANMFQFFLFFLLASSSVNGNCVEKEMRDDVCAIIYDERNCKEGRHALTKGPLFLLEGESELTNSIHDHSAESVKVNKMCTFRGYINDAVTVGMQQGGKKTEDLIQNKGDFVVVSGTDFEPKWIDFEGDLHKGINAISCKCGNKGTCPAVPPYLCAIAYEKVGCETGSYPHPLEIPLATDKLNLNSLTGFNYTNSIESVSVRRGCTFRGFKDADLNAKNGNVTIAAATSGDVQMDLKEPKDLPNTIQSISCTCA